MKRFQRITVVLAGLFIAATSSMLSQIFMPAEFITKPELIAKVGEPYTYKAQAVSKSTVDVIHYHLYKHPSGMTLDTATGLIQWTPAVKGKYLVELVAHNQKNEKVASQVFYISAVTFFGSISGTVKDDSGKALKDVKIHFFSKSNTAAGSNYMFYAVTDADGKYKVAAIDSGLYIGYAVLFQKPPVVPGTEYSPVYYKDSPTINGATPIGVTSVMPIVADFVMHKRIVPALLTVSGVVYDTVRKPIAGAVVYAMPDLKITPTVPGPIPSILPDPNIGCFPYMSVAAKTDAYGKYTLKIYAGVKFIAAAGAPGYLMEYFKEHANPLEADRLSPTKDTSGIDFTLSSIPKITTKVSGKVQDSLGTAVASKMVLYPLQRITTNMFNKFVFNTISDSLGNFTFEGVPNGKYVLQAIPLRGYMPALYKEGGCGSVNTRKFDTVFVNSADVQGLAVCVRKLNAPGMALLNGYVKLSDGTPVNGVVVTAQHQNQNEKVTYGVSDARGYYEVEGLDQGTYNLSVEKIGYAGSSQKSYTVDLSKSLVNGSVDFILSPQTATSVFTESQSVTGYTLRQNYPNPFNPTTDVSFTVPQAQFVTVKVFDLVGREVAILAQGEFNAGSYTVRWNAEGMTSGTYFCRMTAGAFSVTQRMVLMR